MRGFMHENDIYPDEDYDIYEVEGPDEVFDDFTDEDDDYWYDEIDFPEESFNDDHSELY